MGFNLGAFQKDQFSRREREVTLGTLLEIAEEAGDPERYGDAKIIVRGLTSEDVATAEDAADRSPVVYELVGKLLSGSDKEKVSALLGELNGGPDRLKTFAKKLEMVRLGIKSPEHSIQDVVKLAEVSAADFNLVFNHVMDLTGKGQQAQVKRKPSGRSRASKPA